MSHTGEGKTLGQSLVGRINELDGDIGSLRGHESNSETLERPISYTWFLTLLHARHMLRQPYHLARANDTELLHLGSILATGGAEAASLAGGVQRTHAQN